MLERGKTTVSNELKRDEVSGAYTATKAQAKATIRRKASKYQSKKIVEHLPLQDFIHKTLLAGQSPGAVAGRLTSGAVCPASKPTVRRLSVPLEGYERESFDIAYYSTLTTRYQIKPLHLRCTDCKQKRPFGR